MNLLRSKGVSLLELLIAITLLSAITMGFYSLHLFSIYQERSSSRLTTLQNEVSSVLEHMNKNISNAIGNEKLYGRYSVIDPVVEGVTPQVISVYVDDRAPTSENIGERDTTYDHYIGYYVDPETSVISFCPYCATHPCTKIECTEKISKGVIQSIATETDFDPTDGCLISNQLKVTVTACWNPGANDNQPACGTADNPSVSMSTNIFMPSVSSS